MKQIGLFVCAVLVSAAAVAQVAVFVDSTTAEPCNRVGVFARTINIAPADAGYYEAHDCETVFADGVTVILPPLTGTTKLKQIVVRNVGYRTVIVAARQPADVIDAVVESYSTSAPQLPVFGSAETALFLHAGESVTLTAFQPQLPNVWYVIH